MADVTVRAANIDNKFADVMTLIDMAQDMMSVSLLVDMGFEAQHFGNFCIELIEGDYSEIFLAEVDGEIVGALLCTVSPCVTSPRLLGYEHGFYVRPKRRSLKTARLLLETFEEWALELGAVRVQVSNVAGNPDEKYQKLLRRFGYSKAGSIMYKLN